MGNINHSKTWFACTFAKSVQMSLSWTFDWCNSYNLLQYFLSSKNLQIHSSTWFDWNLCLQSMHINMLWMFSRCQQLHIMFRQSEQRTLRQRLCSNVRILWSFSRYCSTMWLELSDMHRISNLLYELCFKHAFSKLKCLCFVHHIWSTMHWLWPINMFNLFTRVHPTKFNMSKSQSCLWWWTVDWQ